jgi:Leucine-rich repeat (LRR) protein
LTPDEYGLADYARREGYNSLEVNKKELIVLFKNEEFILQGYLNKKYPSQEDKENVKEIKIDYHNRLSNIYGGELDLSKFPNLEEVKIDEAGLGESELTKLALGKQSKLAIIDCPRNQLTSLEIISCSNLKKLYCNSNLLTSLDLSQNKELETLDISNNNFSRQDLSFCSHLVNLKRLLVVNNYFFGSLEPLQNLTKLEKLDISDTDISHGLEYLPKSVENIGCSFTKRPESRVSDI